MEKLGREKWTAVPDVECLVQGLAHSRCLMHVAACLLQRFAVAHFLGPGSCGRAPAQGWLPAPQGRRQMLPG